jgi:hypothetical protein
MDWKEQYEDALISVLNAKNEYDLLCIQHHELIRLVHNSMEILSSMKQQMITCSPEDYIAFQDQYHLHFTIWNLNYSVFERLIGYSYRKMVHASEYASIVFQRYNPS